MLGFLKILNPNFLIGAAGVGLAGLALFFYVQTKQMEAQYERQRADNIQLVENVEKLKEGILQSEEAVEFLQDSYEDIATVFGITEEAMLEIRRRNAEAVNEITVPATAEEINKQAQDMNRCFELVSGQPWNEREQNAQTPEEFNTQCPWLFVAD